jgi:hypothetical protein
VIAEPIDPENAITNVQILLGTNLIGNFAGAPSFVVTNLVPSTNAYAFRAIAVDDMGLRATSSVVSVMVTPTPPVTALGPIALNRQNGLFEQYARIVNPTPYSFVNGVRLLIANLDTTNTVYNATGTNSSGIPYIDVTAPLPSSNSVDVLVQYYVPNQRSVPNPTLIAQPLPFTIPSPVSPVLAAARRTEAGIVVQFPTTRDRLYYLQSSSDLTHWDTLPGLIVGNGGVVPRTNSFTGIRFFRALMLP